MRTSCCTRDGDIELETCGQPWRIARRVAQGAVSVSWTAGSLVGVTVLGTAVALSGAVLVLHLNEKVHLLCSLWMISCTAHSSLFFLCSNAEHSTSMLPRVSVTSQVIFIPFPPLFSIFCLLLLLIARMCCLRPHRINTIPPSFAKARQP